MRHFQLHARHRFQCTKSIIAAAFIFAAHGLHRILRSGQCRNARALRNAVCRRSRMTLDGFDAGGNFTDGGGITQTPAGDGIGLGKAVDGHAALAHLFGDRCNGKVLCISEDQLFVYFVRNDVKVLFNGQRRESAQRLLAVNRAGGVVGRADDDRLGVRRNSRGNVINIEGKARLRLAGNKHGRSTGELDHLAVADPAWRGNDDLIARVTQSH